MSYGAETLAMRVGKHSRQGDPGPSEVPATATTGARRQEESGQREPRRCGRDGISVD